MECTGCVRTSLQNWQSETGILEMIGVCTLHVDHEMTKIRVVTTQEIGLVSHECETLFFLKAFCCIFNILEST